MDEKNTRQLLQLLVDEGKALNLEGKLYFHTRVVDQGRLRLLQKYREVQELTMSDFRILVETSRKYALPLLNYYESQGYTTRRGDVRVAGAKLRLD